VHDVLRRRPAIHELLSEALGGSSCNRRAKLSSRYRPQRVAGFGPQPPVNGPRPSFRCQTAS
jgi:hypothetical protein